MNLDLTDLAVSKNEHEQGTDLAEPMEPQEQEPEETLEQRMDRRKLIITMRQYLTHFPVKLEAFKDLVLEDMSAEELGKTLQEMQLTLRSANSIGAITHVGYLACDIAEGVCTTYTPLQLQGFGALARCDEEFGDCLKEMALECGGIQYLPASVRLGYAILRMGASQHAMNKAIPPLPNKAVASEITQRFPDL